MLESPTQRRIWVAAATLAGTILFRVNTGTAWVPTAGRPARRPDGSVVIPGGRPIPLGFGLLSGKPAVGVADLIGWHEVRITPEMVGCKVAVFLSVECKRDDGKGRVEAEQASWRDIVTAAGGIGIIAASADEATARLRAWGPPLATK